MGSFAIILNMLRSPPHLLRSRRKCAAVKIAPVAGEADKFPPRILLHTGWDSLIMAPLHSPTATLARLL